MSQIQIEKEKKRVQFIDMVRGITILFLCMYHIIAPGMTRAFFTGSVGTLLFSFFFFSGYFYTPGKKSIGSNIAGRAKSLLGPFFTYSIAFWLIGSIILVLQGSESVTDALCCLRNFYGGSIWNRDIQDFFGWDYHSLGKSYPFLADFWFLPALFLASVLFIIVVEKAADNLALQGVIIAVMIFVSGILRYFGMSFPYNLQLIPFWSAFLILGNVFRESKLFDRLSGAKAWICGALISVISYGIAVYTGYGTTLFRGTFDEPEVLTMLAMFVNGILCIYGVSLLCKGTEDKGVNVDKLAYLGSHSVYLFLYHVYIAWMICQFTGFSMRYDPETLTTAIFAKSVLLAVISIALSILVSVLADRFRGTKYSFLF